MPEYFYMETQETARRIDPSTIPAESSFDLRCISPARMRISVDISIHENCKMCRCRGLIISLSAGKRLSIRLLVSLLTRSAIRGFSSCIRRENHASPLPFSGESKRLRKIRLLHLKSARYAQNGQYRSRHDILMPPGAESHARHAFACRLNDGQRRSIRAIF